MSEQFFYAKFQLLQKRGVATVPVSEAQEVLLEVPRKVIEDWKRENPEQKLTDQAIAADIARVVVADVDIIFSENLPTYEFNVPTWLEERHPVMNARACDHHDNGIRAWVVKSGDDGPEQSNRPVSEKSRICKDDWFAILLKI